MLRQPLGGEQSLSGRHQAAPALGARAVWPSLHASRVSCAASEESRCTPAPRTYICASRAQAFALLDVAARLAVQPRRALVVLRDALPASNSVPSCHRRRASRRRTLARTGRRPWSRGADAGAREVQRREPEASDRDDRVARLAEQAGGARGVPRDALARGVQRAEPRAAHAMSAVAGRPNSVAARTGSRGIRARAARATRGARSRPSRHARIRADTARRRASCRVSTPVPRSYMTPRLAHASPIAPSHARPNSVAARASSSRMYSPFSSLEARRLHAARSPDSHERSSCLASWFPGWHAVRLARARAIRSRACGSAVGRRGKVVVIRARRGRELLARVAGRPYGRCGSRFRRDRSSSRASAAKCGSLDCARDDKAWSSRASAASSPSSRASAARRGICDATRRLARGVHVAVTPFAARSGNAQADRRGVMDR